jgi:O-antigen/teichoic acid export membrane protein
VAFGGKVGGAAIGVITNGLLARMLSPSEFGAYFLALSIISFGALVGALGLTKTTIRFVAESMGLDRPGRARRMILTVLCLGLLGSMSVSLAYWLVVGDLLGEYLFHSSFLVAVTGLMAGWMAISVMQEITAETFRGFHDIRMATLLGGLATGGSSGGIVMRVLLVVCLVLLWSGGAETDLQTVMLVCVGAGSVSLLLGGLFLRGKLASLGPQGAETSVSPKEVMRDAVPILGISLTHVRAVIGGYLDFGRAGFVRGGGRVWRDFAAGHPHSDAASGHQPCGAAHRSRDVCSGPYCRARADAAHVQYAGRRPVFAGLAGVYLSGRADVGLVYTDYYQSGATVLILLSAAKMVAVWSGLADGAAVHGHQASMLRVSVLTSVFFIIGALLVVRDYGPVGVASVAAATTVLQNVSLVLWPNGRPGCGPT